MSKAKYFKTDNEKQLKTAQFDGYNINHRAFEGLMFQVDVNEDGTLKVYVKDDKDFFSDFNEDKWLKTALDYAYKCDTYSDPNTGEDCWLVLDEPVLESNKEPITIMKTSIQDIASKLGLGKVTYGDNGIAIIDEETGEKTEIAEEPKVGEFKPKRKYLNFISAVAGKRIRFNRDFAYISGKQLSGTLENTKFKITLCDNGTINFEEVDTNLSDTAMRKRLIDDIDSIDVTGYAQKFIVSGLEFEDQDGMRCYLEVDHVKPYDKLMSILEDNSEEVEPATTELSDKGLDFLDMLLKEVPENTMPSDVLDEENVKIDEQPIALTYIEEQFRKMNENKINELKDRIERKESDIKKFNFESKQAEKNSEKAQEELSILETRLETLSPNDPLNGYVFFVSDEQKSDISLNDHDTELVTKISDLLKLKTDALIKHLTEGFYKISLAKKEGFEKKFDKEIYRLVQSVDILGKFTLISDGEVEYRGKLNWHQLTAKMIKKGFEQDPEFDKISGSNSYEVKTEREILNDGSDGGFVLIAENSVPSSSHVSNREVVKKVENPEFLQKELVTFTEPQTIVILGDGYNDYDNYDFQVTDDESGFDIYVGGKHSKSLSCSGFGSILTLSQYKDWKRELESNGHGYEGEISDAYIIPGFLGTIGISAKLEDGSFSTNFKLNDYILHQFEDCVDVVINLPEGTELFQIENHDLNTVTAILRDEKISTVLDEKRTIFIGKNGGWLKNTDTNKHVFDKLNFTGDIYLPTKGEVGEKIAEITSKSGKTYVRVRFPDGECVINKDKLR